MKNISFESTFKSNSFAVLYILWLRQIKKYLRSRARMIGSLAQPLLFLTALWLGFGPIYQQAGAGNYLDFLVPGIIEMSILFTGVFTGIEMIWDKQFGFLKETLVAPASRLTIFIGRTLGGATVALFQGIIIFCVSLLLGFRPHNISMLLITLLFMFMIGLLFTAFGTAIASILDDMSAFPIIINFLIMPIFFLSGALFPLSGLPKTITIISSLNPLSYGVDAIRFTLTGVSHFGLGIDLLVLIAAISLMFGLGAYLFSKIEL